jgi:hypothetical protein
MKSLQNAAVKPKPPYDVVMDQGTPTNSLSPTAVETIVMQALWTKTSPNPFIPNPKRKKAKAALFATFAL